MSLSPLVSTSNLLPSTITVLIVDDSESDHLSYRRYLQSDSERSYEIIEAETLEEGLELWRSQQPDVVLLDINLPDGDGLEFLEAIGTEQLINKLPVIMLTGSGDERIAVRAMKLRAADYLVKSDVTAVSLITCINQVQENNLLFRQLQRSQQQQTLVASMSLHIRRSVAFEDVSNAIVQEIRSFLNADRAIIYRFNPDMSGSIVAESVLPEWETCLDSQIEDTCFQENLGGEYQNGKIFAANDIYKANLSECHLQLLERFQIRANLVVPILLNDNNLWGLLIVHQCSSPRQWQEEDIQLLHQISTHLAIALQQDKLYQNLQTMNSLIEERVQERTQKLQLQSQVLEEIHDAVVTTDLEGTILTWNQGAEDLYGYTEAEVLGKNAIFMYEDAKTMQAEMLIPLLAKEKHTAEIIVISKSGQRLYVSLRLSVVKDDQGNIIHLIGCANDITERKQAEIDLKESEQSYVSLMAASPVGIFRTDPIGDCTYVNDRWCRIAGLTPEAAMGDGWQQGIHPEDRHLVYDEWYQSVQEDRPFSLEYRFQRADGVVTWVYGQSVAKRNDDGIVTGYVGTITDISNHKKTERQLQIANSELARATKLKDEFLANMSHELRTPLNAILGLSESLHDQVLGSLNKKQLRATSIISNSGEHLLLLINDILDLSKIASGMMQLELAPVSVRNLCDSSLVFVKQQALRKKIKLSSNVPPTAKYINVEERRIKQILINLLTNAVKFTPNKGQVSLLVSVGSGDTWQGEAIIPQQLKLQNAPMIVFQVVDTGIGIAAKDLSQLFQPFVQIDSSLNRQYEGTGLGLALVKQIVELHGGQVMVESEIGKGSIFTVALPYEMSELIAPDPSESTKLESLEVKSEEAIAPLILLAEDNEANISNFSIYLTARNYRLIVAKNGKEVIALAKSEKPDIIIMDIQMPIMDGLEATRLIRADAEIADIPIIALTALTREVDHERCLEAGANEYLNKPVRLKQLALKIAELVG